MRLLVRYIASLYVVPDGVRADVRLASAGPSADGSMLELVFENAGTAHALLSDLVLTIAGGGNEVVLGKDALETVAGQNILAGHTRRFVMPWPAGIAPGMSVAVAAGSPLSSVNGGTTIRADGVTAPTPPKSAMRTGVGVTAAP
jgi:fimbrial chaperone protein